MSYSIDNMWSSDDGVQLVYSKSSSVSYTTPLNMDGSSISENKNSFFGRLDKKTLIEGYIFDLNEIGNSQSKGLIYADQDFVVRENTNSFTVERRSYKDTILCNDGMWRFTQAIRVRDKIIYCGYVIPLNKGEIVDLREDAKKLITAAGFNFDNMNSITGFVVMAASSKRFLYITFSGAGAIKSTSLRFMKIDIDNPMVSEIKSIPLANGDLRFANRYKAYYQNGFVLMDKRLSNDTYAFLCNPESLQCKRIDFSDHPERILVEDSTNTVLTFDRQGSGSSSKFKVSALRINN